MALLTSASSLIPSKAAVKAKVGAKLTEIEKKSQRLEAEKFEERSQLEGPSDSFKKSESAEADASYRKWTSRHPKLASYAAGLAAGGAMLATAAVAGGLVATGAGVLAPATLAMVKLAGIYGTAMSAGTAWTTKEKTQKVFKKRNQQLKAQLQEETAQPKPAERSNKSWLARAADGVKNSTVGKILGKQTLRNLAVLGAGVGAMELGLALGVGASALAAPLVAGGLLAVSVGGSLLNAVATISGSIEQATGR